MFCVEFVLDILQTLQTITMFVLFTYELSSHTLCIGIFIKFHMRSSHCVLDINVKHKAKDNFLHGHYVVLQLTKEFS